MKKDQLVALVQSSGNYPTKKDAEKAIDSVLSAILDALSSKEEVALHGFGVFKLVHRPEKTGKVPGKPDQTYTTPATTVVKFVPAKNMKDAVAG